MNDSNTQFSTMQRLKRAFFSLRNGVIADTMRKAGCPHRMIFGLNLPQLNEVAAQFGPDEELAEALWLDSHVRESQLLAPMIYPKEKLTEDKARQLCENVQWHEDADILSFKLLRDMSFAPEVAAWLSESDESVKRYTALRLYMSMLSVMTPQRASQSGVAAAAIVAANRELARTEPISTLASMVKEEAEFLIG